MQLLMRIARVLNVPVDELLISESEGEPKGVA